ncbi:transposase family protein [Deinococcus peraridilitoris]|nr:transposase family protein [Deinococcus peraridilitoris]
MKLNRVRFKRRTGVYPETFEAMRDVLDQREQAKTKAGRPAALTPDEQLLLTLEFWREYRTQAHLGDDWGVHETTVLRTVERVEAALLASGQFSLPRRSALTTETVYSAVLVDVSEVPCERPKKTADVVQRQEEAAHPEDAADDRSRHGCEGRNGAVTFTGSYNLTVDKTGNSTTVVIYNKTGSESLLRNPFNPESTSGESKPRSSAPGTYKGDYQQFYYFSTPK